MKRTEHLSALDLFGEPSPVRQAISPFADVLSPFGFADNTYAPDIHAPSPPPPADADEESLVVRHISLYDFDDDVVLVEDRPAAEPSEAAVAPLLWNCAPARVSRFAPGIHDDLLPRRGRRR